MPLSTNLIAYYKLNESSGDASDSVGGVTLTNTNTATYTTGKILNGVSLAAASTQYLTAANSLGIDGGSMTWAGWVKFTTTPSSGNVMGLFYQGNTTSHVQYWLAYFNNGGTLQLYFARQKAPAGEITMTYNTTLSTGVFYHLAYTFNGSQIEGFMNGVSIGTTSTSGNGTSGGTTVFALGRDADVPSSTRCLNGMIDEVGVWSRALNAGEIYQLYNNGTGITYPFPSGNMMMVF